MKAKQQKADEDVLHLEKNLGTFTAKIKANERKRLNSSPSLISEINIA